MGWFFFKEQIKGKSSITTTTSHASDLNGSYLCSSFTRDTLRNSQPQRLDAGRKQRTRWDFMQSLLFAFSELITARWHTFIKIKFFIIFLLLILLLSTVWLLCGDPLDLPTCLLPFPTLIMLSSGSLFDQLVRLALGQLRRPLALQEQLTGKSRTISVRNPKNTLTSYF